MFSLGKLKNFVSIAFALMIALPAGQAATKEWGTLKIGILLPLSGSQSQYGKTMKSGIESALKSIRVSSPKTFKKIKTTFIDTESKTSTIQDKLDRSFDRFRFDIILGGIGNYDGKKLASATKEKQIPTVLVATKSISNFKEFQHAYLNNMSDEIEAAGWIKKIKSNLKMKTEIEILANDRSSFNLAAWIRKQFKSKKIKINILQTLDSNSKKVMGPLIVLAKNLKSTQLRKIILANRHRLVLLNEQSFHNQIEIQNLHPNLFVASLYQHPDSRKDLQLFSKRYSSEYGLLPNKLAALSYQSMLFIKNAFEQAQSSRKRPLMHALTNIEFESLGLKVKTTKRLSSFEHQWWKR